MRTLTKATEKEPKRRWWRRRCPIMPPHKIINCKQGTTPPHVLEPNASQPNRPLARATMPCCSAVAKIHNHKEGTTPQDVLEQSLRSQTRLALPVSQQTCDVPRRKLCALPNRENIVPRRIKKASKQLTLQENQRKGVRFSNYVANTKATFCTYFLIPNLLRERQSIENLFKTEGRKKRRTLVQVLELDI